MQPAQHDVGAAPRPGSAQRPLNRLKSLSVEETQFGQLHRIEGRREPIDRPALGRARIGVVGDAELLMIEIGQGHRMTVRLGWGPAHHLVEIVVRPGHVVTPFLGRQTRCAPDHIVERLLQQGAQGVDQGLGQQGPGDLRWRIGHRDSKVRSPGHRPQMLAGIAIQNARCPREVGLVGVIDDLRGNLGADRRPGAQAGVDVLDPGPLVGEGRPALRAGIDIGLQPVPQPREDQGSRQVGRLRVAEQQLPLQHAARTRRDHLVMNEAVDAADTDRQVVPDLRRALVQVAFHHDVPDRVLARVQGEGSARIMVDVGMGETVAGRVGQEAADEGAHLG